MEPSTPGGSPSLPPQLTGILTLVVIAAGVTATIMAVKKVHNIQQNLKDHKDVKKSAKQSASELQQLSTVQKPNYLESNYTDWANSLFNLLNGCDFNKNDDQVVSIMERMKSDIDFFKLKDAFGQRTIENCGPFSGNYVADLVTFLNKELTQSSRDKINKYYSDLGLVTKI